MMATQMSSNAQMVRVKACSARAGMGGLASRMSMRMVSRPSSAPPGCAETTTPAFATALEAARATAARAASVPVQAWVPASSSTAGAKPGDGCPSGAESWDGCPAGAAPKDGCPDCPDCPDCMSCPPCTSCTSCTSCAVCAVFPACCAASSDAAARCMSGSCACAPFFSALVLRVDFLATCSPFTSCACDNPAI